MGAMSAEVDYYAANCKILNRGGMEIGVGTERWFQGIPVVTGPMVVLAPSFMPSCSHASERVFGGRITARSTLIVEGDVVLDNLDLDGALWIKAAQGVSVTVKNLTVRNDGWHLTALDGVNVTPFPIHYPVVTSAFPLHPPWYDSMCTSKENMIRGYFCQKDDGCEVSSGVGGTPIVATGFMGNESKHLPEFDAQVSLAPPLSVQSITTWEQRHMGVVPVAQPASQDAELTDEEAERITTVFATIQEDCDLIDGKDLLHHCEGSQTLLARMQKLLGDTESLHFEAWTALCKKLKGMRALHETMNFLEWKLQQDEDDEQRRCRGS